jgi:hypothetical protein
MSSNVDELTVHWEENGEVKVRELAKQVLSTGSWATVMFLFQEKDPRSGAFRAPKVAFRRYQKARGGWRFHSKFHLSSAAQAEQVAATISQWLPQMMQAEHDENAPSIDVDSSPNISVDTNHSDETK